MENMKLDISKAAQFVAAGAVEAYEPKVKAAIEALENGTCKGNDFWDGCIFHHQLLKNS